MRTRTGRRDKGKQINLGGGYSDNDENPGGWSGYKRGNSPSHGGQPDGDCKRNRRPPHPGPPSNSINAVNYSTDHYDAPPEALPIVVPIIASSDEDDSLGLYSSDDEELLSPRITAAVDKFFARLSKLSTPEINEVGMQWHCPACVGSPGGEKWFTLQPLISHMKTKLKSRVKLHRQSAKRMEEELQSRGGPIIPRAQPYGRWIGLNDMADHEIVWPPTVIVVNTRLHMKNDQNKWLEMGNPELLDYFKDYPAVRARNSYGPQGYRGISALIFDSTPVGYLVAERLHNDFRQRRLDREAWLSGRPSNTGGMRQLYGFLATKAYMDDFNLHCQGKPALKYQMKSFQAMVVSNLGQPAVPPQLDGKPA